MISADLTDESLTQVYQKVGELEGVFSFSINLSTSERKALSKMGDKTIAFVDKCLEYADKHQDLVPSYLDITELKKDFDLSKKLFKVLKRLEPLTEKVSDTYIAAGSEAFSAARNFYDSIKAAAKAGVPGTDVIAAELKKRFVRSSRAAENRENRGGATETDV